MLGICGSSQLSRNYMEAIVASFFTLLNGFFQGFLHSTFFIVLKIFFGVYTFVLILDVILLIYLGGFRRRLRAHKYGTDGVTENRGKRRKQWKTVKNRLSEGNQDSWKLAILEAEHLVFKALDEVGYRGENFGERIVQIPENTCSSLDAVKSVHTFRNKIVHDEHMVVTQEQATQAVAIYFDFLEDLGVV